MVEQRDGKTLKLSSFLPPLNLPTWEVHHLQAFVILDKQSLLNQFELDFTLIPTHKQEEFSLLGHMKLIRIHYLGSYKLTYFPLPLLTYTDLQEVQADKIILNMCVCLLSL